MGSNRQDRNTQQTLQGYSEEDRRRFLEQLGLSNQQFQEAFGRANTNFDDYLGRANTLFDTAYERAGSVPALERAREQESLDWRADTAPGMNISNVRGLSPYLNLYERSLQTQDADRTPMPMGASWGGQQNNQLRQVLAEQSGRRRQQEASAGLERAFTARDQEMRAGELPLIGMQNARNQNLASLASNYGLGRAGLVASQGQGMAGLAANQGLGMASLLGNQSQNSTNSWANYRARPSFWQQMLLQGAQGAGQAAAMLI